MMEVSPLALVSTGSSAGHDIYIPGDNVIVKYTPNRKSYNSRWESDPLLKTWITRHPTDDGKVVCQFCQSVIRAHKNDLLEHTRTLKHQRNFMANSTPQDYNEFVICLNELRKDAQVMTNGVKRKRSGKSSSSNSNNNNTMLALPASSSSNSNNNCIISTNNNSLLSNNNIMHINNWTTITNGALNNNNNNNNCKDNNDEDEEDDDENGMNTTDMPNDVDLWPENNHETYISANSPSDLVSVILTETEEQAGSPNGNSNSSCSVSLSSSLPPTLTPIINSNNSNVPSSASPLHHHLQQQQHTVQQARLLKQESTSSCPTSSVQGLSYTVTSCSITSADVISAIQENYFNLSELVEISKSAIDAISQSINPPALIINPPTVVSSQVSSKRDSKRKSKKKGDKNRKRIKAMKQEGITFQMGLETL